MGWGKAHDEGPCPGAGHACPTCQPDIAAVAVKIGAPFAHVLDIAQQAQARTLERLEALDAKERAKAAGERLNPDTITVGNRATRRAAALNERAKAGARARARGRR